MSMYVLPLADPQATLERVGGKGMSLAKLSRAGLPVPPGFHITTDAYRRFVAENDLQPRLLAALPGDAQPASLEAAARQISDLFSQGQIPPEISQEIAEAYQALCQPTGPAAVRSSATAEDLPEASFAGQQETYLNIRGVEAVLEAVKNCWASLWTARAIAYRRWQGIGPEAVALAVVVQELVLADAAGVLFTANPINGRRDEMMLTATWGLGEALVAGAVTPDTLTLARPGGAVLRRETADKQVMTVRDESGVHETATPAAQRSQPVLSDIQAAELARLGLAIEALYARPMDIEWTLRLAGDAPAGEFAIVQARPITALPPAEAAAAEALEWLLPSPKAVLARGSFAEFLPGPVSPLFATLAVPIARLASLKLMGDMGVTEDNSYLFAVLNGYVYIGMTFTPKMAWQMTKASISMLGMVIRTAAQRMQEGREKCLAVVQKWQARSLEALTPAELLAGTREIFAATAECYTIAQSGPIPVALGSEVVFAKFYGALIKRKDDLQAEAFLFGMENQALRAEKALFDLADWAKDQPQLADYLRRTPAEQINADLQTGAPILAGEFAARFAAYLREFGHAVYDLDFARPLPAEEPAPLLESLKIYLDGGGNPYERQRLAVERRTRAAEAITARLDGLRRKWFLDLLAWAQKSAPLREDSIADLGLGYPQIHALLAELGRRLAQSAAIAAPADIYWLEAQEVEQLAAGLEKGAELPGLQAAVERRKAQWQMQRRISPPTTLPQKTWLARFFPAEDQASHVLKGYAASAGVARAQARVLLGPEDFDRLHSGDVIVAGITTPAWTPLFARASAIVTDIGGPLSHSSIVAREYGIPAVLATGSATRRIQDGQWITVDGSRGTVTLE